jgi:uncharacterized protein with HEPN domain
LSPRREIDRLQDILDAVGKIESYAKGGLSRITEQDPAWDAILYNLTVIGEAVKDVSAETRRRAPEVDWAAAAKMRDLLIHRYFVTELGIVTSTIENDLPLMRKSIKRLLTEAHAD